MEIDSYSYEFKINYNVNATNDNFVRTGYRAHNTVCGTG